MAKENEKLWQASTTKREPRFYTPNDPLPKTPDQTAVERWLELADAALKKDTPDPDSGPSAA